MTHLRPILSVLLLLICGCNSITSKQNGTYWTKELNDACESLASSYPINPLSKTETSIEAFNQYFSERGLVNNYENTAPLKTQEDKSISNHLKTVRTFRNIFYHTSSLDATLPVKIKTLKGPPQVQSVQLFFGGSIGPSMAGPRLQYAYTWSKSAPQITLEVLRFDNSYWRQSYDGNWALFRFLDSGKVLHQSEYSTATIPINDNAIFEYIIQGWPDWENIRRTFSCPQV